MGTALSSCVAEDVVGLGACVGASSVDFTDFKVEDIQVYPTTDEQIAYVCVQSDCPQSARWSHRTEGFCVAKVRRPSQPMAKNDTSVNALTSLEVSARRLYNEGLSVSARGPVQPPPHLAPEGPALPVLLRGGQGAGPVLFRPDSAKSSAREEEEEYRTRKADASARTTASSQSGPSTLWSSAATPKSSKASSAEEARWRMLTVTVERDSADESLGVDVSHIEDKLLQVIGIAPKNESAASEVFQMGDVILQVNGIKGSSDQMVRECALREDLIFRVARPEDEEAADHLIHELIKPRVPPLKLPQLGVKKAARPGSFAWN